MASLQLRSAGSRRWRDRSNWKIAFFRQGWRVRTPRSRIRAPTPAVTAMASAPQNVTRIAPTATPAPPARAARPPRMARNTSDVADTTGIRLESGDQGHRSKGMAAPTAKAVRRRERRLDGPRAQCLGDAELVAGMRASASWAMSCSATWLASAARDRARRRLPPAPRARLDFGRELLALARRDRPSRCRPAS